MGARDVRQSTLRHSTSQISSNDTPFPVRQLFILALCRLCEPIAFMSIFPYIYYMIKSFGITQDGRQIAMYAGMVTSAFALAEFLAGAFWGRLSDRIGRKPVLLTGIFGTGISMVVFGFARSLPLALFARAMGGLLNGNIGVIHTTVAEVVKAEKHRARGFSIIPFVWSVGSIVGASLGGALAEPVKNYPNWFHAGSLFDKFPYLLPNLVCAAFVTISLLCGLFFLDETHEDKMSRRDPCLLIGKRFLALFLSGSTYRQCAPLEKLAIQDEEIRVEFDSRESTPRASSVDISPRIEKSIAPAKTVYTWKELFTPQVMLNILAYGLLALHTISLEQLLPILFSMPHSTTTPQPPFRFVGGLNLSAKTVGFILSAQGLLQVFAQMYIFPKVHAKLGSIRTFRIVIFSYPMLYWLIPYITLLPELLQYPSIMLVLVWKTTAQAMSYPCNTMMLVNHAPSTRVLGTLNGFAASAASLARTIGPVVAGLIQASGLRIGISGLPWWSCAAVAACGACVSLLQREYPKNHEFDHCPIDDEETMLCEAIFEDDGATHNAVPSRDLDADNASIISINTLVDDLTPDHIHEAL